MKCNVSDEVSVAVCDMYSFVAGCRVTVRVAVCVLQRVSQFV